VVAEKIFRLADLQKKGKFKPKREKDVLNAAIGSKHHEDRVRAVSSKLGIKDGFKKDRSRYKSHDPCKEEMYEAAEKALHENSNNFFIAIVAEHQQWGLHWFNLLQEVGHQRQMVVMPPQVLC